MRIDRIEGDEYWTAESLRNLWGWEAIHREPWTEAVTRLHCRRSIDNGMEFRFIYCRTSILREVQQVEGVMKIIRTTLGWEIRPEDNNEESYVRWLIERITSPWVSDGTFTVNENCPKDMIIPRDVVLRVAQESLELKRWMQDSKFPDPVIVREIRESLP